MPPLLLGLFMVVAAADGQTAPRIQADGDDVTVSAPAGTLTMSDAAHSTTLTSLMARLEALEANTPSQRTVVGAFTRALDLGEWNWDMSSGRLLNVEMTAQCGTPASPRTLQGTLHAVPTSAQGAGVSLALVAVSSDAPDAENGATFSSDVDLKYRRVGSGYAFQITQRGGSCMGDVTVVLRAGPGQLPTSTASTGSGAYTSAQIIELRQTPWSPHRVELATVSLALDAVNTTVQAALMRLQSTQGNLEAATGTLGLAVNNISDTLRNMEVCAASGQIAHQAGCRVALAMCDAPSVQNAIITPNGALQAGLTASAACSDGYHIIGPSSIVCRLNGTWDAIPRCSACGSRCAECESSTVCTRCVSQSFSPFHGMCTSRATIGTQENPGSSCKTIKQARGNGAQSGLYYVQRSANSAAEQVYCDQETASGGWEMVWKNTGGPAIQGQGAQMNSLLFAGAGVHASAVELSATESPSMLSTAWNSFYDNPGYDWVRIATSYTSNGVISTQHTAVDFGNASKMANIFEGTGCIELPSELTLTHDGVGIGATRFAVLWPLDRPENRMSYGLINPQSPGEMCGVPLANALDASAFTADSNGNGLSILRHFFSYVHAGNNMYGISPVRCNRCCWPNAVDTCANGLDKEVIMWGVRPRV